VLVGVGVGVMESVGSRRCGCRRAGSRLASVAVGWPWARKSLQPQSLLLPFVSVNRLVMERPPVKPVPTLTTGFRIAAYFQIRGVTGRLPRHTGSERQTKITTAADTPQQPKHIR